MHHNAPTPTSVKIMLVKNEPTPNRADTKSNPKRPMLPQFIPPIITKRSAIVSITIIICFTPFSKDTLKVCAKTVKTTVVKF